MPDEKPDQSEAVLLTQLDQENIPGHVAIIMDGNGRWANHINAPRVMGHYQGIQSAREAVRFASELGIKTLSLFAFSSENWNRPPHEVATLMTYCETYLEEELENMLQNGVRLKAVGRIGSLSPSLQNCIRSVESKTAANKKITLVLALNYGGRSELVDTLKKIVRETEQGRLSSDSLSEQIVSKHLYTDPLPDPDLLIRTGGEMRISNFFLWQMAYTELYFTKVLWPNFGRKAFLLALLDYQRRERRFGLLPEQNETLLSSV